MRNAIRAALMGCTLLFGAALPMAAHAAPTPEQFGQRIGIQDAAISPDGSELAVIQNVDGKFFLRLISIGGESDPTRAIGLGGGVKPNYVKWVSNERLVVSLWQTEKLRREVFTSSFLYTVDTQDMKGKILVRPREGFRQFNDRVVDWLEDDPDHIMMQYADDGEDQTFPDVRRVNVASGRSSVVKRSSNSINHWVTDSEGEPVVGLGSRAQGEKAYMIIRRPGTDKWDSYADYPGLDPETQNVAAVTRGGTSLILSAYRGKDKRGLHRYDLNTRQFTETLYENDRYDVGNVILSKDGERIVGASFTGEAEERVLFDEYDSTFEEALEMLKGYQVDFVDQTEDSTALLLRVSSPSDPGGLYLFRRGGSLARIAPNMAGLKAEQMGEVLSIGYKARDGQRIPAYVTLPSGLPAGTSPQNLPFIVMPHGGPFARDEKRFDYMAQFYASLGYGVLQMNFRGSEGFGKSFADAGRNNWVVMQDDVEDGMRWLLDKGYADPDRTCIAGWSYGGYAALMGASKDPDLYNCAIAIAALTDIPDAVNDIESYINGRAIAKRTFGDILDDKALLRANNPVDVADAITVPVFMAHGTLDTSVEIDQFRRMRKRLDKAGVDGTYMEFKNEDHYMSDQANRQSMLVAIAKFLRKTNGKSPYAKG